MDQNPPSNTNLNAAPRKAPHPLFLIAAACVAAVALIAGAQILRPGDAASANNATASSSANAAPASRGPNAKLNGTAANAPALHAAATSCAQCGVVVAVREMRQAGEGTGVGAVAGAVVGGVVGHQFGAGHGKDALTIAGAAGGALAGHQIEKQARATTSWRVDVKMNDGTTRTFNYGAQPTFAAGEKVEIKQGQLVARG
jgi:outer membrane lipoprotein SlyB